MKNICLILVGLTFLSVLPSYATKIIVNDNKDRIVYSRSSRPPKTIITEEQYVNNYYNQANDNQSYGQQVKTSWIYNHSKRNARYNQAILDLGNDIREELVGTRWNYPEHEVFPVNEQMVQQQVQEYTQPERIVETKTTYIEDERFNRASREASDYYMVDIVNAPNTLVPSWVPEQ